jgi:hypothetical protein
MPKKKSFVVKSSVSDFRCLSKYFSGTFSISNRIQTIQQISSIVLNIFKLANHSY